MGTAKGLFPFFLFNKVSGTGKEFYLTFAECFSAFLIKCFTIFCTEFPGRTYGFIVTE